MFCKNCGTQLNDNEKFCPGCGARNEQSAPVNAPHRPMNVAPQPPMNNAPQRPMNAMQQPPMNNAPQRPMNAMQPPVDNALQRPMNAMQQPPMNNAPQQPMTAPTQKKSKKKVLVPIIAVVLVLAIAAGGLYFFVFRNKKNEGGKYYVSYQKMYEIDSQYIAEVEYKYDDYGNVIGSRYKMYYISEEDGDFDWLVEYKNIKHNRFNKLSECDYYVDDEIKGKIYFEYDDEGQLLSERCDNTDGTIRYQCTYSYDSQGNLIKEDRGDEGCRTYSYDSKGNVIKKVSGSYIYEYEYDEHDNVTVETLYKNGELDYKKTYSNTYSDGKLVLAKVQNVDDENNVSYYADKYYYDKNGNLEKEEYFVKCDTAKNKDSYSDCPVVTIDGEEYFHTDTITYEYVCIK